MRLPLIPLPLLALLALGACDIRADRPGFTYPASSDVSGPDWPELAVTEELAAAGAAAQSNADTRQADADRLAARARALQARAARLRQASAR